MLRLFLSAVHVASYGGHGCVLMLVQGTYLVIVLIFYRTSWHKGCMVIAWACILTKSDLQSRGLEIKFVRDSESNAKQLSGLYLVEVVILDHYAYVESCWQVI